MLYSVNGISQPNNTQLQHKFINNSHKIIFGSEFNISNPSIYSNYALEYYDNHVNIGVIVNNVLLFGTQTNQYEQDTYLNASYTFNLPYNIDMEIGGKWGANLDNSPHFHTMDYIDLSTNITEIISIHFGGYYINKRLSIDDQPVNFQTGISIKYDKFLGIVDYYDGDNLMSGGVASLTYKLTSTLRPYIGINFPNSNTYTIGFTWRLDI